LVVVISLFIIFLGDRMMFMMMLQAAPMAGVMRVVVFRATRTLGRISISAVTVTELVIKKPSCYPIRAIGGGSSEVPIICGMLVAASGDERHSFILRLLLDVAPVIGGLSLAVLFEVVFIGR
jgi:hypothetical protein